MAQIQDFVVKGGLVAQSTSQSLTTASGALITSGGAGIGGNINASGNLFVNQSGIISGATFGSNGLSFSTNDVVITDSTSLNTINGIVSVAYIGTATLSGNTGTVINTATNLYVAGAPASSTLTSIVNSFAVYVNSGSVYIGESKGNIAGFDGNALEVVGGISAKGGIYVTGGGSLDGVILINGSEVVTRGNQNTGTQFFSGQIIIDTSTQAISTLTGALVIRRGGLGVGGNIYAGGYLAVLNTGTILGTVNASSTATGAFTVRGGVGIGGSLWATDATFVSSASNNTAVLGNAVQLLNGGLGIGGTVYVANTSDSSLVVQGGATFAKGIFASDLTLLDPTTATGYLAAPLMVTGGAYIGANLIVASTKYNSVQIAGGVQIAGNIDVNGNSGVRNNLIVGGVGSFTNHIEVATTSYITGAQILTTATIATFAVTTLTAGTDTAVSTSTGDVIVWSTATLQSITNRGATTTNAINILNSLTTVDLTVNGAGTFNQSVAITTTTNSTGTNSGALTIAGGIGIGGSFYAHDASYIAGSQVVTTSTLGAFGVTSMLAGTDTAINTTTGEVTVWDISTLNSVTKRGNTTSFGISIFNNSQTAFVVTGGARIGGDAGVGGNFIVTGTSVLTDVVSILSTASAHDPASGALVVSGGLGVAENLYVGGTFFYTGALTVANTLTTFGNLNVYNTAQSTSTTTGAIVVQGGVGIGGDVFARNMWSNGSQVVTTSSIGNYGIAALYAGTDTAVNTNSGIVIVWNTSTFDSVAQRGSVTTSTITINNTLTVSSNVFIGNNLSVQAGAVLNNVTATGIVDLQNISDSISPITGAVKIAGGLGVQGNIYATAVYDQNARVITTATIGNFAVTSLTAGTDTAVSSSQGDIVVWNTSTLQTVTQRGGTTDQLITINNTLTVAGDSTVGGNFTVTGVLNVFQTSTIADVVVRGIVTSTNTTQSISTVTGAVQLTGGLGVGGNIYAGAIYDQNARVVTTSTIGTFGIRQLIAGTDTAINTSTGVVTIWNTSTFQTVTDRGNSTTNKVYVYNTLTTNDLVVTNTATIGTLIADQTSYAVGAEIITTATIGQYGVTSLTAGTDTVVSTSTGGVTVWNNSTLQSVTDRGATTDHAIDITNATPSGSTAQGALKVAGGVGISGNLYVGQDAVITGNLTVLGTQTIVDSTTTNIVDPVLDIGTGIDRTQLTIDDGLNKGISLHYYDTSSTVEDNMFIGRDIATGKFIVKDTYGSGTLSNPNYATSGTYAGAILGNLIIKDNTSATSTFTGAFHVVGGGSVEQDFWIGGTAYIANARIVTTATLGSYGVTTLRAGTDTAVSTSTGNVIVWNTSTFQTVSDRGNSTTNIISLLNQTDSNDTSTGALTVAGGVGVGRNVNVGGTVTATILSAIGIAQSNDINTGALTVAGGAGIAKNLNIGGALNVAGRTTFNDSVTFLGTSTYVYSQETFYTQNLITLHATTSTSSVSQWTFDDGKDVGIKGDYYDSQQNQPAQFFFGWRHGAPKFEFFVRGYQNTAGNWVGDLGGIQVADLTLTSNQNGTSSTGALQVAGGGSLGGNLYVGQYADVVGYVKAGSVYDNNNRVVTYVDPKAGYAVGLTNVINTGTYTTFTIQNLGVTSVSSGTGITVSASTGDVTISSIDTLQLVTARGFTTSNRIVVNNLTPSNNYTTGALVVSGGVGIGGALYVNNKSYIANAEIITTATVDQFAVTLLVAGTDTAVSTSHGIVSVWNTSTLQTVTDRGNTTTNIIYFANTSNSTGTTTGGIVVDGGVGIAKDVYIGGTLFYSNQLFLASTTNSTSTTSGALVVTGGVGIGGNLNVGGNVHFYNTSTSSGTTSGAVIIDGGLGVGGDAYFNNVFVSGSAVLTDSNFKGVADIRAGTDTAVSSATGHITIWNTSTLDTVTHRGNNTTSTINILNTTPALDATSGAFTVAGGVGISGNLYGQNFFVNNTIQSVNGSLYLTTGTSGSIVANGVNLLTFDTHVWYVSAQAGNNTNDGRRSISAFATLGKALSQAVSGDVVFVEAGTYSEVFPLTIPQGVTVKGAGLRATIITPTAGTRFNTAFYLNGETNLCDLSVTGFFQPGWALEFALGCKITTKSPYVERFSVITRGSTTSGSDPYGYNTADAGNGAKLDAGVLDSTSLEPAMLFNEVTFIVPNATGLYMTNGARAELLNGFFYFAGTAINAQVGTTGFGGQGKTRLKLSGVTGSFGGLDNLIYKGPDGTVLASGTISTVQNGYVYLNGPAWGYDTVYDRTPITATAYGSAKLATGQKKYGTASLLLSTSTDYVEVLSFTDIQFTAASNYTVEAFVYPIVNNVQQNIFAKGQTTSTSISAYIGSDNKLNARHGNTVITSTGTIAINTWTHIAIVRTGISNSFSLYIDGVLNASAPSVSNNVFNTDPFEIGANASDLGLIGYVDELRISNIARYSTTFTPSLPINDAASVMMLHFNGVNNSTYIPDDGVTLQNIYAATGGSGAKATRIVLADYHQFGAELRCIGSAAVFGNQGVIANGTGTDLKLIAFNMSFIGAGGDLTDDATLSVQSNEVIQTNNGKIYYQTVDQVGDFRVGDHFLVNQRTGNVTFNAGALNLNNISSLTISDGTNRTVLTPGNIVAGNIDIGGNSISSLFGNITIDPAGTSTIINSNLQVNGSANISQTSYVNGSQIITAGTIGSFGVTTLTAGTDTAVNTSTGNVIVWNTSTLQSVTDRGNQTTNDIALIGPTQSSSTSTGALRVVGGVGIGGAVYAGVTSYVAGSQIITTSTVRNFAVTTLTAGTDTAVNYNQGDVIVWNTSTLQTITDRGFTTTNLIVINNSANAISTSKGALTVLGGLAVGRDIWAQDIYSNNSRVITQATLASQGVTALYAGTDTAVSTQTGIVTVWNTSTLDTVTNRGNSTRSSINILNTFNSIGTNSGALTVAGGVGIAQDLYVGGAEIVNGNVTAGGKFNTFGSTVPVSVNATTATVSVLGSSTNGYQLLLANYPATDGIGFGVDPLGVGQIGTFGQNAGDLVLFAGNNLVPAIRIGGLSGQVRIVQVTSATNTNSGALIVAGGVGIGGALYIGQTSYVAGSQIVTTGTISQFAVTTLTAGTDTAVNTSTGAVVVWNTSTLDTVTSRGNVSSRYIKITDVSSASSTSTGALQVVGGVGIGGDTWVGGNLYVNGSAVVTQSTLGQQGVVAILGGTDTAVSTATGSVVIWNYSTLQSITNRGQTTTNAINITNGTSSTDFTTGALTVSGGVGIGQNLFVQGTISASGGFLGLNPASIFQNTSSVTVLDTGSVRKITVTVANTTNTVFSDTSTNFYVPVNILSPLGSTGTNNGALTVAGGVGITGNTFIGATSYIKGAEILTTATVGTYSVNKIIAGTDTAALLTGTTVYIWNTSTLQTITSRGSQTNQAITFTNPTQTSGTASGAVVVTGGVGIGGGLYVGGDTTLIGNLTVLGTQTTIYSTATSIQDPVLNLGSPSDLGPTATDDGLDKGILIHYNTLTNTSGDTHSFFGMQRQTEKFVYFTRTPQQGRPGIDNPFTLPTYGAAQFGSLNLVTGNTSSNATSGDLVTTGGAGIGGNLNVAGNESIKGGTSATSTTTGALTVLGGVGITGDIYVGGNGYFSGSLVLTTATIGTSGIGVVNIIAGTDTAVTTATGAVTIWNTSTLQTVTSRGNSTTNSISILNGLDSTTLNNGALVVAGGVGILKNLNIGGDTRINSTSTSASTNSGALTVAGGLGVGGNAYYGGNGSFGGALSVGSATPSSSTTSGAFTVTGGAGIGGALNLGSTATIGGAISAVGTATFGTNLILGTGAVNRGGVATEVYSNGNFSVTGDAQAGVYLLRRTVASTSSVALTVDGIAVSTVNQIALPDNSTYNFRINVTARSTTSTYDAGWAFSGVISRYTGPGTTVIRVVNKEKLWATSPIWDCNVSADATNGALQITVNGDNTNTVKFVAKVETVEVTT